VAAVSTELGFKVVGGGRPPPAIEEVGGRRFDWWWVAAGAEGVVCWEVVEVVTGLPREEEVVVGSPWEEMVAGRKTREAGWGSAAQGTRRR
jgi:hypothetical protein